MRDLCQDVFGWAAIIPLAGVTVTVMVYGLLAVFGYW